LLYNEKEKYSEKENFNEKEAFPIPIFSICKKTINKNTIFILVKYNPIMVYMLSI
jgi:hypothetical protein